ncbi:MAG: ribonuclease Z [Bacteroidota bacterium]
MKFEVSILGTNAAIPAYDRMLSAQVFNNDNRIYLIDCGESTQLQLKKLKINKNKIRQIFISHLHGDHIFGLPGLITSFGLLGRDHPLEIFAPAGMKAWLEATFKYSYSGVPYELIITEVDPTIHQLIYEDQHVDVFTIPLEHRIPTCGYLFREKPVLPKIIPAQIEKYGLSIEAIKKIKYQGEDYVDQHGNVIPNSEMTTPPPYPRSYAYCSDTAYSERIIPWIEGVDLLYHESTYMQKHLANAIQSKHSTAIQAANIAAAAGVGQLLLGHYSSRYQNLLPLLEEAKSVFPNTFLAEEEKSFGVERRYPV